MPTPPKPRCAFCGKTEHQAEQLIAGPGVYICDECVRICDQFLDREEQIGETEARAQSRAPKDIPPPHRIKASLDEYVVGQDHAKKVLSVAVHNHYKRIRALDTANVDDRFKDVEIEKSNVMLIGPTGCGKTLLAQTLARLLDVPFSISDATTVTEAGYVGEDVENILLRLIQSADGDIRKAETGIVYIDEIDKIARRMENVSITRDVSGEGVQQALLKIIEGTVASVPPQGGRKHPQQDLIKIDTTNILFILGGAFVGLGDIVERRMGRGVAGYHADARSAEERRKGNHIEPEDLRKFGLIPEFLGRIPIITELVSLAEDDLIRILVEPRNAIVRQYQKLLAMEGVDLEFEKDALRELAAAAVRRGSGARGLRAMIEHLMLDVMFEIPGRKKKTKTYRIGRETVIEHLPEQDRTSTLGLAS